MERNPLSVTPPSWLDIDLDSYKRLLNRTAVTITKRARKRGATYQVREAIDAIHACLLYTSPSPRDISGSRMPSSA